MAVALFFFSVTVGVNELVKIEHKVDHGKGQSKKSFTFPSKLMYEDGFVSPMFSWTEFVPVTTGVGVKCLNTLIVNHLLQRPRKGDKLVFEKFKNFMTHLVHRFFNEI